MAQDPDMSCTDAVNYANTYTLPISATYNGQPMSETYSTIDMGGVSRAICLPELPGTLSASEPAELLKAKYPAVLWSGKGVEYLEGGEWKPVDQEHISGPADLFEACRSGRFRFNPVLFKKQGGEGHVEITVRLITTDGTSIPGMDLTGDLLVI